jgi:putative hydrolase of the HAD superfamily
VTPTSADSAPAGGYEAVLFDALGTLVELEPPWPLLQVALAAHGIELGEEEAKAAMLAEMAYYRAHHMEGADSASLDDLRARGAAVLRDHLPAPAARLSAEELTEALLAALSFRPYPDAAPALGRLRQLGIRTAVVSNWDVSLKGVLAELGLGGLVDRAVVSAEARAAKPAPAIFEQALRGLRCPPRRAMFVGDSPETDIAGALGAGMRAVLVDRFGQAGDVPVGVERIATLASLEELVRPAFPPSP